MAPVDLRIAIAASDQIRGALAMTYAMQRAAGGRARGFILPMAAYTTNGNALKTFTDGVYAGQN